MKSYFLLAFLSVLLLTPVFAVAQEESEESLTELPTIIVKGEDRSYLQIERPKQIYYMSYKGEKERNKVPYKIGLPPLEKLEIGPPAPVPSVEVELFPVKKPEEIPAGRFALPSLSQNYITAERLSLPSIRAKEKFFLPEKVGKKEIIRPPLQITLRKEIYVVSVGPSFPTKEERLTAAAQKRKIPTSPLPYFTLSQRYIEEERTSLLEEQEKEKILLSRKTPEGKKVTLFSPLVKVPEKPVARVILPKVSVKPSPLYPSFHKKEISPAGIPEATLREIYLEASLKVPEEEKEPLVSREVEVREKRLIRPPLIAPAVEKPHFPERIKKSEYPFLIFSVGTDNISGFNYQFDYAREKEERRYFLTLKRDSFPKYATYQNTDEFLSKEIDVIQGGIGWGETGGGETQLLLGGKWKNLGLPDQGKRKDTYIHLSGKTSTFKRWKIGLWGQRSTRDDTAIVPERKYEDFSYGASLVFQPQESDFLLKGELNWDNLKILSPTEDTRSTYQALLQIESLRPFSIGENLFLESVRVGVRGIQNRQAQLAGSLKVHWYVEKNWEILFGVDKKSNLPLFSETYIPQDYSHVNLNIGPVNITTFSLETNYSQPLLMGASLRLFSDRGEDVIWVYEETLKLLKAETISLSRQGVTLKGNWHITPNITLEPSLTWQNVKNEEAPDKVVPHQPESSLGALLTIQILKRDEDSLTFQAEGEWLGKRYYKVDSKDTIAPSSKVELKLAYKRKTWGAFLGFENNSYFLSKDYKLFENRLKFGAEIKLF